MGVNVVIEMPDDVAERLRRRAARREHSVEDEMLEIVAEAVVDEDEATMSLAELVTYIGTLGLTSTDESVAMVREDRDRADGRH